jgi:hypothetical protein
VEAFNYTASIETQDKFNMGKVTGFITFCSEKKLLRKKTPGTAALNLATRRIIAKV